MLKRLRLWLAALLFEVDEVHTFRLPAWCCPNCQAFNGESKETLHRCRCCGAVRP